MTLSIRRVSRVPGGRAEDGFASGPVHFLQGLDQVGQSDTFSDGFIDDAVDLGSGLGLGGGGGHG